MFLAPLLDVATTAVLDTEVTTDEAVVCDCGSEPWLLDELRFGLRDFSCLSDDWELKGNALQTITVIAIKSCSARLINFPSTKKLLITLHTHTHT